MQQVLILVLHITNKLLPYVAIKRILVRYSARIGTLKFQLEQKDVDERKQFSIPAVTAIHAQRSQVKRLLTRMPAAYV